MNYAFRTDSRFSTEKDILKNGKLSETVINRRKFIRSHNFSLVSDSKGEHRLVAVEKDSKNE